MRRASILTAFGLFGLALALAEGCGAAPEGGGSPPSPGGKADFATLRDEARANYSSCEDCARARREMIVSCLEGVADNSRLDDGDAAATCDHMVEEGIRACRDAFNDQRCGSSDSRPGFDWEYALLFAPPPVSGC